MVLICVLVSDMQSLCSALGWQFSHSDELAVSGFYQSCYVLMELLEIYM